ncbi:hypothetical protein KAR91_26145 [Candidatus Pacearchaeota archaeon]|nr:hypothetical protein [Candidatus Pacearchaeota archaeon]
MKIIRPIIITDEMLTASNVPEDDYAEFVMGTTYADGDNVIVSTGVEVITLDVAPTPAAWGVGATITGALSGETAVIISQLTSLTYEIRERTGAFTLGEILSDGTNSGDQGAAFPTVAAATDGIHKIYESLVDSNVGNYPPNDVQETVPKWLEISATNRWKAFDEKVGSQTSQAASITYTIEPGVIVDSFAFLNMIAGTIQVVSTDPVDGEVYNETISMLSTVITGGSGIYDWYTYFFSTNFFLTDVVRFDLPPYLNAVLTITITLADGIALCGGIVLGVQTFLGNTQYSPSIGIRDYSVKQADQFGVQTIVKRAFAKIMTADLTVETASISDVQNILASYRAELIVWVGDDNIPALIVYGFYKDFNIVISYPAYAICSLDVEGLT